MSSFPFTSLHEENAMGFRGRNRMREVFGSLLFAVSLIVVPVAGSADTRGQERRDDRQDGREVRQEGRQDAREAKQACKEGDEKSRAECRQDKRGAKQDAREGARDTRRGN